MQWLEEAIPRLKQIDGIKRLDEELLCLLRWLSLNPYEKSSFSIVKKHFESVMQTAFPNTKYSIGGSTECGLYEFQIPELMNREHPNSNVNILIDTSQKHMCDVNELIYHLHSSHYFQNGCWDEKSKQLHAMHIVKI